MDAGLKESLKALSVIWQYKILTVGGVKLGLGNILIALILLLFAKRLSQVLVKFIDRRLIAPFVEDQASKSTYQTFAFYAAFVFCVTLSLTVAGIPLTVFTVLGGALAIGVGFGSQNIVNNFISGIILLIETPIRVGDVVEVDGITGVVTSIGTRSTKIKNAENKVFIAPNSLFLEKGVINWTYETTILRTILEFGVAYGSDVKKVEKICLEVMQECQEVEASPAPVVLFTDFAESNLTFQMIFFADISKISSLNALKSQMRFKIEARFREQAITMAFPQRDMHLNLSKPLSVKLLTE